MQDRFQRRTYRSRTWLLFCSCRLLALPASTRFEDLLGTKAAAKSALKSTAGSTTLPAATHTGMTSIGVAKRLKVHHVKDGQPLDLELQVQTQAAEFHAAVVIPGAATLACVLYSMLAYQRWS